MLTIGREEYLNFMKLLQDENNEVTLVTKKDIGNFPAGSRFKPTRIIFNEAIHVVSEDTGDVLYLPLTFELMTNPMSALNSIFAIHIDKKDSYEETNNIDISRIYPSSLTTFTPLELNGVQEEFLREYTYIIRARRNIGDRFIKERTYHVIQENHSKNEHLIFVINEKGVKESISCRREDFENPHSFINNFDFFSRKGSHKVEITKEETSIEEDLRRIRQEKEDFLKDIIEYPRDYKIVCIKSVENEDYSTDEEDCEDEEPFCFIAGRTYFGDLSQLDYGRLEIMDEMTRVNGLNHIVIESEEEFFEEDSWFNRHFEIVER